VLSARFDHLIHLPLEHQWVSFFGLLIGKATGIVLLSLLAVKLRLSTLRDGLRLGQLIGAGFLGGIGFTMDYPKYRLD